MKKVSKQGSQEARTWILFVVGIAIAIGMAKRGQDPGPYWTIIIGAFVGLGVVISAAISAIVSAAKMLSDDESKDNTGEDSKS